MSQHEILILIVLSSNKDSGEIAHSCSLTRAVVASILNVCLFDLNLYVPVSNLSVTSGTGLPGLNQYEARINVSWSRTQHSDADEVGTRRPSVLSQALYHCATALPQYPKYEYR